MICNNPECPDRIRTGIPGEYREGIDTCPKCGARLQAPVTSAAEPDLVASRMTEGAGDTLQEPPPHLAAHQTPAGAVLITTFAAYEQASLTADRLLAAGLHPVLLVNDFRSPVEYTFQFYSPTRLVVPEAEADDARALIEPPAAEPEVRASMPRERLTLFEGDITTLPVDAIVNAANETLLGGGGVDGAIHEAAGPKLRKECRDLGGCRPGDAKLTHGYDLPALWVIHTVGPVWRGGENDEEETLRRCYRACFRIAREKELESIAFPSISTGAFRYPVADAARIAVDEIRRGLRDNPRLEVTVACFGPEVVEAYETALASSGSSGA